MDYKMRLRKRDTPKSNQKAAEKDCQMYNKKCKFQQLDENEERIQNHSGLADGNAKPSQSRRILRKKKTVNYLEETLNTSNTLTRPLNDKPKLPIYKQQLEKRAEPKNDLYEFDSYSEKVSKRKKKQVDDSSFVVKIKTKRGPKKKINKQHHMTVQEELDDWGDAEPSMSPDRGMNNSRFFFTENIPRANSTMITRTKLNNPKRSNYTVTDKENLSPNVTPLFKIKKNRKVTDYFKSDKIEKLSNIDEHISQSQNKIVDRRSSEDEAEVVQDNEDLPDNECLQGNESDDDDDDWFDFEKSSKKTYKTPKPINAFRPWRFNQINVNRSPLFITLKDTALPSINQELVVNHTIAKKIKTTKANTCEEGNHDWVDDGEVKLFEDTVALVSDEEDEAPEEFDAKLMKKSKFKLKYFLNMDVPPKKPKDVRTKEEQKAADDWANAFNLMCKEVEEFPLEIE